MNRDPLETLRGSWKTQGAEEPYPWSSPVELERRARRHARKVLMRNVAEWAAAAVVVAFYGISGATADRWLTQLGCGWTVVAALWISWVIARRGTNLSPPASDAPMREFLRHERAQLERQAVLLERVPTWYAMPFAIGTALILVDRVRVVIERGAPPGALATMALVVLVVLAVYLGILIVNRRAASELRNQLRRLSSEE